MHVLSPCLGCVVGSWWYVMVRREVAYLDGTIFHLKGVAGVKFVSADVYLVYISFYEVYYLNDSWILIKVV